MESNTPYALDCSIREDYADSPPSPEGSATVCESGALYSSGWIKLHRRLLDHPKSKDADYMWLWIYLVLKANYSDGRFSPSAYQTITIKRGQLATSRDKLSKATGIDKSKITRLLDCFKTEQQIEQQSFSNYRLITILNYDYYQQGEQQDEQQVNSNRTASEHNIRSKEEKEYTYSKQKPQRLEPTAPLAFADATAPAMPEGTAPCTEKPARQRFRKEPFSKDGKRQVSEFVWLTGEEIIKLKERFGENEAKMRVLKLNDYIGQIGEKVANNRYKNHYYTILNWSNKENK